MTGFTRDSLFNNRVSLHAELCDLVSSEMGIQGYRRSAAAR